LPGNLSYIESALHGRHQDGKYRSLYDIESIELPFVTVNGTKLLNLCSNDYLALSNHHRIIELSGEYLKKYGAGSRASRLVSGTHNFHTKVEESLAVWLKRETALVFNSGFQLNSSLIAAIAKKTTHLYFDKRNHNSLVTGALSSDAKLFRYRHLDYAHLDQLLEENASAAADNIIVSESVFSMDGDVASINELTKLAKKYNAILIVDEAHAIGVSGKNGRGLCYENEDVDIIIGTFGKSFGSFGAFIACNSELREYLINFCNGFIYTTALPPSVIGSIAAALELMPHLDDQRKYLLDLSSWFRGELSKHSFDISGSESHIIPIVTGNERSAVQLAELLKREGYLGMAIRPPTVEPGRSRIRLTMNSLITRDHLNGFIEVIQNYVSSKDD
jgi:8-amino-7-oxononanoate synthase